MGVMSSSSSYVGFRPHPVATSGYAEAICFEVALQDAVASAVWVDEGGGFVPYKDILAREQ